MTQKFANSSVGSDDSPDRGGLYVHIPYCRSKCIYCDFYSAGSRIADYERLVDALLGELEERLHEVTYRVYTLYIGGGTPSVLPSRAFVRLANGIRKRLAHRWSVKEFTIEVNPDDVTPEMCRVWQDAGINRISMGVQSFNDRELKFLRRSHDAERAEAAFSLLRQYFPNVSLDLIFGIPGQEMTHWEQSVARLIQLRPEHVSCYSLMYEEGTALTLLRDTGRVKSVDDDTAAEMYTHLRQRLTATGYQQYEISNYSLPGYHSRHNSSYWHGTPYLGIGPSAHSYDGATARRANPADLFKYLDRFPSAQKGSAPYYQEEYLSEEDLNVEYIMTRLRTAEGIATGRYAERFSQAALTNLLENATQYLERGDLKLADGSLSLTPSGVMISDKIIVDLME